MIPLRLSELAKRLACRLEGDGALEISSVAGIEEAGAGDLTFFANPRYTSMLRQTRATAVILGFDVPDAPCAMLRTSSPYLAFADAVGLFMQNVQPPIGIHSLASIASDAEIGEDVSIGPFVVVESGAHIGKGTVICPHVSVGRGSVIGDDCLIHAHASIRERVIIGNRVILQNGAVIGSDGFGFARREDGSHKKIPQSGQVIIEDDVEVGANTTIDRPSIGETRVGAGTKIDNLVQVAHGVSIGQHVLLASQVGIAGSTTLEDKVVLAGQVGVAGHLKIGRAARASAQTGIPSSVEAGSFVSGYPAIENRDWLKSSVIFKRLPELKRKVLSLEKRIAELEELLGEISGNQKT